MSVTIDGTGSIAGLTTPVSIAQGGTNGTSASAARTALGLSIGTDIQAYNANTVAVAPSTSGNVLTSNGSAWISQAPASSAPTSAQVGTAIAGQSSGAVGTYGFFVNNSGSSKSPGNTLAGSSLLWSDNNNRTGAGSPSGTWMCCGYPAAGFSAVWVRTA